MPLLSLTIEPRKRLDQTSSTALTLRLPSDYASGLTLKGAYRAAGVTSGIVVVQTRVAVIPTGTNTTSPAYGSWAAAAGVAAPEEVGGLCSFSIPITAPSGMVAGAQLYLQVGRDPTDTAPVSIILSANLFLEYTASPHTHLQSEVTGLTAALSGKVDTGDARLTDARAPTSHTHPQSEVSDLTTDLAARVQVAGQLGGTASSPDVRGVRETGGPTLLSLGAVTDGQYLKRSGTSIVGDSPAGGTLYGVQVVLHHPHMAASAVATNLAINTVNAVSDPSFRQMVDLRGMTKVRIQGRFGGAVVAATKLRIQYHVGVNPAVATGDAGWTTLADSAGSHTVNTMFYSAEIAVPAGAQINNCLLRCVIFSGDGAADPTISTCILNFYP
jgi:hypothetical protein